MKSIELITPEGSDGTTGVFHNFLRLIYSRQQMDLERR